MPIALPEHSSISIIVPARNEAENIQGSLDASVYAAERNFTTYEIIVVNDGSTDDTLRIVEKNMKANPNIRVISHPVPRGFGASFNTGRKEAKMHYTVMVHGDDVFERENLSFFFSHAGKADVILGFIENPGSRNKTRRVISFLYTKAMNRLFGLDLRYFNGIQIHSTRWLRNLDLSSDGFGFMAEIVVKALKQGLSYIEVPYRHRERPGGGTTKIFKPKNILSVVRTTLMLLHKFFAFASKTKSLKKSNPQIHERMES